MSSETAVGKENRLKTMKSSNGIKNGSTKRGKAASSSSSSSSTMLDRVNKLPPLPEEEDEEGGNNTEKGGNEFIGDRVMCDKSITSVTRPKRERHSVKEWWVSSQSSGLTTTSTTSSGLTTMGKSIKNSSKPDIAPAVDYTTSALVDSSATVKPTRPNVASSIKKPLTSTVSKSKRTVDSVIFLESQSSANSSLDSPITTGIKNASFSKSSATTLKRQEAIQLSPPSPPPASPPQKQKKRTTISASAHSMIEDKMEGEGPGKKKHQSSAEDVPSSKMTPSVAPDSEDEMISGKVKKRKKDLPAKVEVPSAVPEDMISDMNSQSYIVNLEENELSIDASPVKERSEKVSKVNNASKPNAQRKRVAEPAEKETGEGSIHHTGKNKIQANTMLAVCVEQPSIVKSSPTVVSVDTVPSVSVILEDSDLVPIPTQKSESYYQSKYESLLSSYEELKRVGVAEAKERFDEYREIAEARFEGYEKLLGSFRSDESLVQSQKQEIEALTTENERLKQVLKDANASTFSTVENLQMRLLSMERQKMDIEMEVQKLQAVNAELQSTPAAVPVRDAIVRIYAELTGLDILDVRRGSRFLEDDQQTVQSVAIFECRQRGRRGSLTYKLMIPMEELHMDSGVVGVTDHFTYVPELPSAETAWKQQLPDYLREEIDFDRTMASLFFSRVTGFLQSAVDE